MENVTRLHCHLVRWIQIWSFKFVFRPDVFYTHVFKYCHMHYHCRFEMEFRYALQILHPLVMALLVGPYLIKPGNGDPVTTKESESKEPLFFLSNNLSLSSIVNYLIFTSKVSLRKCEHETEKELNVLVWNNNYAGIGAFVRRAFEDTRHDNVENALHLIIIDEIFLMPGQDLFISCTEIHDYGGSHLKKFHQGFSWRFGKIKMMHAWFPRHKASGVNPA